MPFSARFKIGATPKAIGCQSERSRDSVVRSEEPAILSLYTYVIEHDYGFAPNPFYGTCTLATCKPIIREHAGVGDYLVGTGCARRKRRGYLVYFMRVEGVTTYDKYWAD